MSKDSCHIFSGQHISQTNIEINRSFLFSFQTPVLVSKYQNTIFWNYKSQSQSSYQTGSLRRSTAIRRKKLIKVWDHLLDQKDRKISFYILQLHDLMWSILRMLHDRWWSSLWFSNLYEINRYVISWSMNYAICNGNYG